MNTILWLLKNNPFFTAEDLSIILGRKKDIVEQQLKVLVEKGALEKEKKGWKVNRDDL